MIAFGALSLRKEHQFEGAKHDAIRCHAILAHQTQELMIVENRNKT